MSAPTTEVLAGSEADLRDGRLTVRHGDVDIVVFEHEGELYAYQNICPHMGGPVCQGKLGHLVVAGLDEDDNIVDSFSPDQVDLFCPWHGYSFDITSGVCRVDSRFKLRRHEVVRRDGAIHVVV